jgi:hypothetical protein
MEQEAVQMLIMPMLHGYTDCGLFLDEFLRLGPDDAENGNDATATSPWTTKRPLRTTR